jgi:hypothetical protein
MYGKGFGALKSGVYNRMPGAGTGILPRVVNTAVAESRKIPRLSRLREIAHFIIMPLPWTADFIERSPMFGPLRPHGMRLAGMDWPSLTDLQNLLAARRPAPLGGGGVPLRFTGPQKRSGAFEDKYEARIYLRGEVEVRPASWHDLMNALVWLAFPLAKAALNARHFHALQQQRAAGASGRGPLQDTLTLFDEGGVIVAASDARLLGLLREFRWKELFWGNRARIASEMHFCLFGHALYEKALQPYAGITGHGILFEVGEGFFAAQPQDQCAQLDALLASRLGDAGALNTTRELAPVPVLGVPGWCAENEREAYYDNTAYFRAGRARGARR